MGERIADCVFLFLLAWRGMILHRAARVRMLVPFYRAGDPVCPLVFRRHDSAIALINDMAPGWRDAKSECE